MREIKLYTTICSSAPSELLVALALRHGEQIVQRQPALCSRNLPLLEAFLERRAETFEWVPRAPGRSASRGSRGVPDVTAWCERIATEAGVLLLPGSVYGQPGHVRLGYGRARIAEAIERLETYLRPGALDRVEDLREERAGALVLGVGEDLPAGRSRRPGRRP